jgi:transcriptional regulator with XRE-family HTH domain
MHLAVVKKIKNLSKSRNITAQEMADKLNIDLSAYHRLESGKTYTWSKYLDDLLAIFEISVEDFFHGIGQGVNVSNKNGSFGGNLHVENIYADNREILVKIEQMYEERLRDKDAMIAQLQKIIEKLTK